MCQGCRMPFVAVLAAMFAAVGQCAGTKGKDVNMDMGVKDTAAHDSSGSLMRRESAKEAGGLAKMSARASWRGKRSARGAESISERQKFHPSSASIIANRTECYTNNSYISRVVCDQGAIAVMTSQELPVVSALLTQAVPAATSTTDLPTIRLEPALGWAASGCHDLRCLGFADYHEVLIEAGKDKEEMNEIEDIIGNDTMTLKNPLQFSHDADEELRIYPMSKSYGRACGADPSRKFNDPCRIDGKVTGLFHAWAKEGEPSTTGLFDKHADAGATLLMDGDVVVTPDQVLLDTHQQWFFNRTISLWFRVPTAAELSQAHDAAGDLHHAQESQKPRFKRTPPGQGEEEVSILYSEGDATESGMVIYITRNATAPYLRMYSWDHDNDDGVTEYGSVHIAPHATIRGITEGKNYWASLVFENYYTEPSTGLKHMRYRCRLWRPGYGQIATGVHKDDCDSAACQEQWAEHFHCGEVHLPHDAHLPHHGGNTGSVLGGVRLGLKTRLDHETVVDPAVHSLSAHAAVDYVSIFNEALSDEQLAGPFPWSTDPTKGQLCAADTSYGAVCDTRSDAIALANLNALATR